MTVRDLFNTFIIPQYVCVSTPREYYDSVSKDDIPKDFVPYLDCDIVKIEIETEIVGQCCGVEIEQPILYIDIRKEI